MLSSSKTETETLDFWIISFPAQSVWIMVAIYLFNLFANNFVKIFISVFSNRKGRKDPGSISSFPSFNISEILASYKEFGSLGVSNE